MNFKIAWVGLLLGISGCMVEFDLDSAFGQQGIATIDLGGSEYSFRKPIIDGTGRILLAGHMDRPTGKSAIVIRLTKDGQLDREFGQNGSVEITDVAGKSGDFWFSGIIFDPESDILAGGMFDNSVHTDICLACACACACRKNKSPFEISQSRLHSLHRRLQSPDFGQFGDKTRTKLHRYV